MLDNILKYQQIDMEKAKLERMLYSSVDKKNASALVEKAKNSQAKTLMLEKEASNLLAEKQNLITAQNKGASVVEKMNSTNLNDFSYEELLAFANKVRSTENQLVELENRLNKHKNNVAQTIKNFEHEKSEFIDAKSKHAVAKSNYEKLVAEIQPKLAEIDSKLKDLHGSLEQPFFAKYQALRKEGIIPAYVPIVNNTCGGCRMSLSLNFIEKIKSKGYAECEQCHRVIYNK